ncbi:hypothetical protein J6TS2_05730 [Heyndrickxia sporothermodurans]|nr:hypothetical protein J6TS2_05730 [Heyndrickxia sporothermodurans]
MVKQLLYKPSIFIDIFVIFFIAALGEKVGSMRYVIETMNYFGIEVGNVAYLSVGSS